MHPHRSHWPAIAALVTALAAALALLVFGESTLMTTPPLSPL